MNFPFVATEDFFLAFFESDFVGGGELDEGGDVGGAASSFEVVFGHFSNGNALYGSVLDGNSFVFGEGDFVGVFFAFCENDGEDNANEENLAAEKEEEKVVVNEDNGFSFDGGESVVLEHGVHGEVFAGVEIGGGESNEPTVVVVGVFGNAAAILAGFAIITDVAAKGGAGLGAFFERVVEFLA